MLKTLLVITAGGTGGHLYGGHSFLFALNAIFVLWIYFESIIISLESLMVLFHEVMAGRFPRVSLHEFGVNLNALVSVLQSRVELHQLNVSGASVRVDRNCLGVSAKTFVILFESLGIFSLLEELITLLSVLLSNHWVDVGKSICVLFGFLGFLKSHLDAVILILEKSLLISIDTLLVLLLLEKSIGFPGKSLR